MALTRLGLNQSINLATNVTGTLATGNGGTGATSFSPGKIGQVLQSEANSPTTISTTSYSSIGLSQAITCSATSSKVLIMGYVKYSLNGSNGDKGFGVRIRRDTTAIQTSTTLYDAYGKSTNSDFWDGDRFPFMYIDSPSSTSAITYSVRVGSWNSLSTGFNNDSNYSQIQCWEILA
tara:strand:- start:174 stop:704 length:531 start_codon:yes stop_codon:yes gene_type:complete